jgi:hypothetical protein
MTRLAGVVRPEHRRIAGLIWNNGWMVLLPVVFVAVSIAFWRALAVDTGVAMASQIDGEDATLCVKFGFAVGTAAHDACKLDLLDLRHDDRQLVAAATVP